MTRDEAQPVAQLDPQRRAAFGPHFILALRRLAAAVQLAQTLGLKGSIRANRRMKSFLIMAGALFLLFIVFMARVRKRQKAHREVCQAVFDAAYAKSEDVPSLQMSYGFGMPIFKVTHLSRAAHERSELSGANASFLRGVQAACEECGTQANPYDASRAIHFAWLEVGNEVLFPSGASRDDAR
ncbi:hypothetical protein [Paucibacter sp. B51]|uniref:hypothetical protein n=1 Tax=Paucibacter sp. B51 TaxID=2993315 RepID=UPI0022EC0A56|nr:hypothetical protein [Paucibacter sp. B51]